MESALPLLTLLDVKNHLFVHFLGHTTFSLKEELESVKMGQVYDDPKGKMGRYKEPLLRAALEDMVKIGVLLVLDQTNGVYMLTQPLGAFNQTVVISPYTANMVADAFNFFARQTNATPYVANKLAVTDVEINAVAQLCFALRDELDSIYEDMEDGDEAGDDMPSVGGDPSSN